MVIGRFNVYLESIFWEFGEIDNYLEIDKSCLFVFSICVMINVFMSIENRNVNCLWV